MSIECCIKIIAILCAFVYIGVCVIKSFYWLQLNEYVIKSIITNVIFDFRKKWFVYLLTMFVGGLLFFVDIILLDIMTLIVLFLYIIVDIYVHRNVFRKIKYTKRMLRLIMFSMLLSCVVLFFVAMLNFRVCVLFCACIIFVSYIIVILSFILLSPIEKSIARYYLNKAKKKIRNFKALKVVGITGSFGKTTVKEILNSILNEEFNVLATPKNFNTPLGLAITINNMLDSAHEVLICEMGAKKLGEIKELCDFVKPHLGVVTAVGRQHLNTFGSIDNVYLTKKELPDSVRDFCVFNLMNSYTAKMKNVYVDKVAGVFLLHSGRGIGAKRALKCYYILFAGRCVSQKFYEYIKINNCYAKSIVCGENGSVFVLCYNGCTLGRVSLNLLGEHNVVNCLLAVSIALRLGMGFGNILNGINNVGSVKARLEKIKLSNGCIVINNGYNSNIDSATSTLSVLKYFDKKHKVVVTPGLIDTDNDYQYNVRFGEIVAEYATSVIIVKEKNRKALLSGLNNMNFDAGSVLCVAEMTQAMEIIDKSGEDYVYVIENDLPENYR